MGLPEPLVADARFTRAGFELNLAGQATLAKLLPAAANFRAAGKRFDAGGAEGARDAEDDDDGELDASAGGSRAPGSEPTGR